MTKKEKMRNAITDLNWTVIYFSCSKPEMDKCRKDQILLLLVIDKYILIRILTISLELLPSWSATLTDLRLAFSVTGEKAANNPKDRRERMGRNAEKRKWFIRYLVLCFQSMMIVSSTWQKVCNASKFIWGQISWSILTLTRRQKDSSLKIFVLHRTKLTIKLWNTE